MKKNTIESLADSMNAGLSGRPAGRLQSMFGKEPPKPIAVPLNQDAYEIELDHVEPDPDQPRKVFDENELLDLAASIKENGLLQPVIVYRADDSGKYRIIAGERRYRAAQLAGLSSVSCLEMPHGFDRSLIDQLQLVENIQRADLHPVEASQAIDSYIKRHQLSQREAAKKLGKPVSFVAELLAIRKIPDSLLGRGGVSHLPKQTLVEIGRAPAGQQEQLLAKALAGESLQGVKIQRANRKSIHRVVYFRETFPVEHHPPIQVFWKRHPDDVTERELVEALSSVIRSIAEPHAP